MFLINLTSNVSYQPFWPLFSSIIGLAPLGSHFGPPPSPRTHTTPVQSDTISGITLPHLQIPRTLSFLEPPLHSVKIIFRQQLYIQKNYLYLACDITYPKTSSALLSEASRAMPAPTKPETNHCHNTSQQFLNLHTDSRPMWHFFSKFCGDFYSTNLVGFSCGPSLAKRSLTPQFNTRTPLSNITYTMNASPLFTGSMVYLSRDQNRGGTRLIQALPVNSMSSASYRISWQTRHHRILNGNLFSKIPTALWFNAVIQMKDPDTYEKGSWIEVSETA